MTLSFDTTDEGYTCMREACHPSDRTCRPQILIEDHNPMYYDLLREFSNISGRGAILNTSFNLHGFPIVNTPSDAIHVLLNSDLDCLVLNNFLIKRMR